MYSRPSILEETRIYESVVDWKVFAAWVETEGSINTTVSFRLHAKTGKYWVQVARSILIPQSERTPLDALQRFLHQEGIYSKIRLMKPSKTALSQNLYYPSRASKDGGH